MDKVHFELCKEVYKKFPEWNDTFAKYQQSAGIPEGEPYLSYPELERRYGLWSTQDVKISTPYFDTDYLLDKLRDFIGRFLIVPQTDNLRGNLALFADHIDVIYANSPAEALLKLVVVLEASGSIK